MKVSYYFLTIKITEWGTKKTLVKKTCQRPDIIGMETSKFCCCYVSDPFYVVHQYISEDHL